MIYKSPKTSGPIFLSFFTHTVQFSILSHAQIFVTPWTAAHQAPPYMGFSRQECWSGLPIPSPGDLPDLGIKPRSPTVQADALLSEPPGKPIICMNSPNYCHTTIITTYMSGWYA